MLLALSLELGPFLPNGGFKHLPEDYLLAQSSPCTIIRRVNIWLSREYQTMTQPVADMDQQ